MLDVLLISPYCRKKISSAVVPAPFGYVVKVENIHNMMNQRGMYPDDFFRMVTAKILIQQNKGINIAKMHITTEELRELFHAYDLLESKLRTNTVAVKDFEPLIGLLQLTFYFETMMPEWCMGNVRGVIIKVIKDKFLPHAFFDEKNNRYGSRPEDRDVNLKIHHTHRKLLMEFVSLYNKIIRQKLCHEHINDGRAYYAQVLADGLAMYRLFIHCMPEDPWHYLVDLKYYSRVHKEFIAHVDVRNEMKKFTRI